MKKLLIIIISLYEAGHMMYTHQPDRIKLSNDIRMFLSE